MRAVPPLGSRDEEASADASGHRESSVEPITELDLLNIYQSVGDRAELERWVDIEPGETAKREEEDKDETRRKAMDAISSGNQVATQRIKDLMQSTEKAGRSPEEPFAA